MARINNLSLKKVHKFVGQEGNMYQGNLYLGSKKIGFWSQDGYGGADWYDLEPNISLEKLKTIVDNLNATKREYFDIQNHETGEVKRMTMPYSLDSVMIDLLELNNIEKNYKDFTSDGYDGVLYTHSCYIGYNIPINYSHIEDKSNIGKFIAFILRHKEKDTSQFIKNYRIYLKKEDFDIGQHITLKDITK